MPNLCPWMRSTVVLLLGCSCHTGTGDASGLLVVQAFAAARSSRRTSIMQNPTRRRRSLILVPLHASCDDVRSDYDDEDMTIPDDDDDISQHTAMVTNATTTTVTPPQRGYRPIEEWHAESQNANHVLDRLKREQAHWKSKFEDLGGDGI